jgi:hypothetical protein
MKLGKWPTTLVTIDGNNPLGYDHNYTYIAIIKKEKSWNNIDKVHYN